MSIFKNLRVLEFASVLAGPAVGAFFAELGAEVIKIENPRGGDVTRSWKLPQEDAASDCSAYFSAVNWGKQSLGLDLKSDAGQNQAHQWVQKADIVVVNFKPGDAEKLGLDYATLKTLKPNLIYAHLSGYGLDDPRAGYDALIQAESGFMYLNAAPGGPAQKMPVALIDLLAAHQLKEAILVALLRRERSGEGAHIHVSLMASALASLANQASNWLVAGHAPQPLGTEHPNIVPYGLILSTQDGPDILLAVGSDGQFKKLCALIQHPEWAADPRFATNAERVKYREPLKNLLRSAFAKQPGQALLSALQAAHIPAGPIHTIPQALAQPQADKLRLESEHITGLRTVAFEMNELELPPLTPPPPLSLPDTN